MHTLGLGGTVGSWVVGCIEVGPLLILGLSVGPLGRVDFSSENPLVSPGLLPLGLAWGEPDMGVQASLASEGNP